MNTLRLVRRALPLFALPLVLALCAPTAQAQKLSIGFGKHGKHVSGRVSIGIGFGAPHCRPPVVVRPAPCPPPAVWIPGHYALVERRVYVPGCQRQEYVPPVYENRTWRDYRGRLHVERIEVAPATWRTVQEPGTWQTATERVWIEGAWRR